MRDADAVRWWSWAGHRADAILAQTSPPRTGRQPTPHAGLPHPALVDPRAMCGLKFSAALPERMATATLVQRLADFDGALASAREPVRIEWAG
ncbi:hypothetical protein ACFRU3_45610 [Streptomyces sp. NPDC056910]|uniref:hypothetical protein n=1 Tax=Streptomyces sp. NPDC056910 TaxID=3345964 RepID=UPI0036B3EBC8